jgi:hypothetical protein
MVALIVAPAAYLLVPLTLPLDLIPKGLREDVKSKLKQEKSRGFFKLVIAELDGALERAGNKFADEAEANGGAKTETGGPGGSGA